MTRTTTISQTQEQTPTTLSVVQLRHRIDAAICATLGNFKKEPVSPHADAWLAMTISIQNPDKSVIHAHYHLGGEIYGAGVWKDLLSMLTAGKTMTHLDLSTTDDERVLSLAFRKNGEIVYIHTKVPGMVGLLGGQYDPPQVQILNH